MQFVFPAISALKRADIAHAYNRTRCALYGSGTSAACMASRARTAVEWYQTDTEVRASVLIKGLPPNEPITPTFEAYYCAIHVGGIDMYVRVLCCVTMWIY